MIGIFSSEPMANLYGGLQDVVVLSVTDLENGTLPQTDVLLLPEYYNLDEDTTPFDLQTGLVGFNEVVYPDPTRLADGCFYYNGWPKPPTAKDTLIEIAGDSTVVGLVKEVFKKHGIGCVVSPPHPGLITPRVIAMIINEAHLLLQEGMASAEDIDTSMRLGTGYPLGPFAWEQLWGEQKTRALLGAMAEREPSVVIPYWEV